MANPFQPDLDKLNDFMQMHIDKSPELASMFKSPQDSAMSAAKAFGIGQDPEQPDISKDPTHQIETPSTKDAAVDKAESPSAPLANNSEPKFRNQQNAHDTEVAQISNLLNQLDEAQKKDMANAHMQRAGQLWAKAGNAVAHGFAPDAVPSIADQPLTPLPSNAGGVMNKAKMRSELNKDLFSRENPEEERINKRTIETQKLLASIEELDKKDKARKEAADLLAKTKHEENVYTQGETNNRSAATNATTIGAAEIGAKGGVARGVGEKAASEEYVQAERENRQTYDGEKYHAPGVVKDDQATMFDKGNASYGHAMISMSRLKFLLDTNPRAFAQWGSDARTQLQSAVTTAMEDIVKANGDGVVNGKDAINALKQLGSPETAEQFIANNGPAGLEEVIRTSKDKFRGFARGLGYEPGEGKSSKLEDVHKRASEAGSSGGGSKPRVTAQDALNAGYTARHGGKPTLTEKDPGTPDIPAKDDSKKKRTIIKMTPEGAKTVIVD